MQNSEKKQPSSPPLPCQGLLSTQRCMLISPQRHCLPLFLITISSFCFHRPLAYTNEIRVSISRIISSCHSYSSVSEIITSFGRFPTFCQFSKCFWSHSGDPHGPFAQQVLESIRISPELLPIISASELQ